MDAEDVAALIEEIKTLRESINPFLLGHVIDQTYAAKDVWLILRYVQHLEEIVHQTTCFSDIMRNGLPEEVYRYVNEIHWGDDK